MLKRWKTQRHLREGRKRGEKHSKEKKKILKFIF